MATVLRFPAVEELMKRHERVKLSRAKELIFQAAELLEELGEGEARVAWLLEDCVELLGEPEPRAEA